MILKMIVITALLAVVPAFFALDIANHTLPRYTPSIPWAALYTGYGIAVGIMWFPFITLVALFVGLREIVLKFDNT